jgi:hypothetical protein
MLLRPRRPNVGSVSISNADGVALTAVNARYVREATDSRSISCGGTERRM